MKRLMFGAVAAAVAMTGSMFNAPVASAGQTLVVDDDGQQCGATTYPTITAALDQAVDGDIIRVCPGRYAGGIHVSKSVRIVGPVDAVGEVECLDPTPSQLADLDLSQVAVVQPIVSTTEASESLLTLDADDIEVAGLVLQGVDDETPARVSTPENLAGYDIYTPAVTATDSHSGYRIHHNLIRLNFSLGLELGSSGATKSRVHDNCFRENDWALANQRQTLTDAVIETNTTHKSEQVGYEIGWGLAGTNHVTVQDNTSVADGTTLSVENSDAARVLDNTVTSPTFRGFRIMGGNDGLQVSDNLLTGNPESSRVVTGISLFTPTARVPGQSGGVVIDSNIIANMRSVAGTGLGIALQNGSAKGVELFDNAVIGNGGAGLMIQDGNKNNLVRDNVIRDNLGFGVRIQGTGSTGNRFTDNVMLDNGTVDARDDTDPVTADGIQLLNTWIDNTCVNDIPAGAICGAE
jgi:hypothetical protein